jgi:hypothetical protein
MDASPIEPAVPSIPLLQGRSGPFSKHVDLECEDHHLFLIIEWPAEEEYHNQVGGYACRQRSLRGLLLPLHDDPLSRSAMFLEQAMNLFFGLPGSHLPLSKYGGWCPGKIDREDERLLNDAMMFVAPSCIRSMVVNSSLLDDCDEAWIHVLGHAYTSPVLPGSNPRFPDRPLIPFRGVLTWLNSD